MKRSAFAAILGMAFTSSTWAQCLSFCGGSNGEAPRTAAGHVALTRPDSSALFLDAFQFLGKPKPDNVYHSFTELDSWSEPDSGTGEVDFQYTNPGGPGFINYAARSFGLREMVERLAPSNREDNPVVFFNTVADGPGEAAGRRMAEEAEWRRKEDARAAAERNRDYNRPVAIQLQEATALREKLKKDREEGMKDFGKEGHVPYWIDHVSASRLGELDRRLYGTTWPTPEQIAKGPTMKDEPKPPAPPPAANPPAGPPKTGSVLDTLEEPTPAEIRKVQADRLARNTADAAAAKEQAQQQDAAAQRIADALFSGSPDKANAAGETLRFAPPEVQNRVARKIVEHVQRIVDAGVRAAAGAPRTSN